MPIGQVIALGIGSPANINQLVLAGLSPTISGSEGIQVGSPTLDGKIVLAANTPYATPSRIVNITWLASGAANLQGSLDSINWVTLDTTSGNENRTISNSVWPYIMADADITVYMKKAKKL